MSGLCKLSHVVLLKGRERCFHVMISCFQILSAILHLGNISFTQDEDDDACDVDESASGILKEYTVSFECVGGGRFEEGDSRVVKAGEGIRWTYFKIP